MKLRVIAALLLVPLVDVVLLVVLATWLGAVLTVALVVLTALVGLLLVRAEGRHTMARIQRKVAAGTPPTDELLDGALLLVAGVLMLTPGYLTDVIGLLFVLPPTRLPIRLALKRFVVTPYLDSKTDGFATGQVYFGGFPNQEAAADVDVDAAYGFGPGARESASEADFGDRSIEVDDDAYAFDDVDEDEPPEDGDATPGR